jgi:hypothetical protein
VSPEDQRKRLMDAIKKESFDSKETKKSEDEE